MNAMLDSRGRTKRRGNYQPYRGKVYTIEALITPLDEYVTHVALINGRPVDTGTPESLRQSLYRQGADEEVAP